jgi:heme/copper-type cytochrome/quinol oxidase subunit 2
MGGWTVFSLWIGFVVVVVVVVMIMCVLVKKRQRERERERETQRERGETQINLLNLPYPKLPLSGGGRSSLAGALCLLLKLFG